MKIKLDENIPASLSTRLAALGHDVDSVPEESLNGHPDTTVWSEEQAGGRFLVTQDLDFSDVRQFSPAPDRPEGSPPTKGARGSGFQPRSGVAPGDHAQSRPQDISPGP